MPYTFGPCGHPLRPRGFCRVCELTKSPRWWVDTKDHLDGEMPIDSQGRNANARRAAREAEIGKEAKTNTWPSQPRSIAKTRSVEARARRRGARSDAWRRALTDHVGYTARDVPFSSPRYCHESGEPNANYLHVVLAQRAYWNGRHDVLGMFSQVLVENAKRYFKTAINADSPLLGAK